MNWKSATRLAATLAAAATLVLSGHGAATAAGSAPMATDVSLDTAFDTPGFASKQFLKVMEEAFRLRLSQTGNFEPHDRRSEVDRKKKDPDAKIPALKCMIVGTVTVGTDYFQNHQTAAEEAERNPKFKKKSGKRSSKATKDNAPEIPTAVLAITIDARLINPVTGEVISVANTAAKPSQAIRLPTEAEMQSEYFGDSPFGELTTDAAAQIVTQFNAQAEKIQKKLTPAPPAPPATSGEPPVIQEQ